MDLIRENDRLTKQLKHLRNEIDFGIKDAWKNSSPTYKGCEPLITSKQPVHCDILNVFE